MFEEFPRQSGGSQRTKRLAVAVAVSAVGVR